jgi:hypothetical protein
MPSGRPGFGEASDSRDPLPAGACVGHTKAVTLPYRRCTAGPRVLEHIVDTVVYMEGGRQQPVRLVRRSLERGAGRRLSAALRCSWAGLSR